MPRSFRLHLCKVQGKNLGIFALDLLKPTMGIIQSWKAVNIYIDALARYGIDSSTMPSDLSGRVCKITCEASANLKPEVSLDVQIQRSAALVALCTLGPHEFSRFKGCRHDVSLETVARAASGFKMGSGRAASLDLKIIYAVAASGNISRSFCTLFSRLLSEAESPSSTA